MAELLVRSAPIGESAEWLGDASSNPSKIRDVCDNAQKMDLLRDAVESVEREYPAGTMVRVEVESDPEAVGFWLNVCASTTASTEIALAAHDRVVDGWIATASTEERPPICFTFDLL